MNDSRKNWRRWEPLSGAWVDVRWPLAGLVALMVAGCEKPYTWDGSLAHLLESRPAQFGTILEDPHVDAAVVGIVPLTPALQTLPKETGTGEDIKDPGSICRLLPELAERTTKPVVAVVDSGDIFDPMAAALETGGLPVFRSADRAMRTLCRWVEVKGGRSK